MSGVSFFEFIGFAFAIFAGLSLLLFIAYFFETFFATAKTVDRIEAKLHEQSETEDEEDAL